MPAKKSIRSLLGVQEQTEELETTTSQSMNSVAQAHENASVSFKNTAMTMNTLALSGANLYMSYDQIQKSEIALDRAHVTLEKDTNAVQAAQEKYNEAVAKYGPNSQEATDAANKLKASQDALTVAHERLTSPSNVNNTMMMSALTVIPSVIGILGSLSTLLCLLDCILGAFFRNYALGSP